MTPAIIALLETLIPQFLQLWEEIRANNTDLNLKPASAFLDDATSKFNQIATTAEAQSE